MGSAGPPQYPDELNPFDSNDEDNEEVVVVVRSDHIKKDDYPDYLSPFGEDDCSNQNGLTVEDYDDSLNPFGDDEEQRPQGSSNNKQVNNCSEQTTGNPFDEEDDMKEENEIDRDTFEEKPEKSHESTNNYQHEDNNSSGNTNTKDNINNVKVNDIDKDSQVVSKSCTPQPDSLEPPKPLPRTKSLLKKEQAFKRRQEQEQQLQHSSLDHNHPISLQSTTSSTTSSSSLTTTTNTNNHHNSPNTTIVGSFQRNKNKRNAPPVPVNFKRQVPGSLDAIDEELNSIGNKLEIIEKESDLCQEMLKARGDTDESDFTTTRNKYIELIKRKGSIMRRQRELMYEKRELKLDQIYSDIEYELRMIGNKQLSSRTSEDEAREKELLKKLVEIVEEKNDIVENLNKISSSDDQDIEEAFRRLNIVDCLPQNDNKEEKLMSDSSNVSAKQNENCDKKSLAKFSKIATLLPRGGTIKGTMKPLKHTKRLFKKARDSTKQQPQQQHQQQHKSPVSPAATPPPLPPPPRPATPPPPPPPPPPLPSHPPPVTTTTTTTQPTIESSQQD